MSPMLPHGNRKWMWDKAKAARKARILAKWQRGAVSPQMKQGLVVKYIRRRQVMVQHHEIELGDPRLYNWVIGLKAFLNGRAAHGA